MAAPKGTEPLATALRALLDELPRGTYEPSYVGGASAPVELAPLRVARIETSGRTIAVHRTGKRAPCEGDRAALLTLLGGLWPDLARCHDPRDLALGCASEAFVAYLQALADVDRSDAQALCAHLFGSMLSGRGGPFAKLFDTRPTAWKHLSSAASGGALVKKAIPLAREGRVVERVAVLRSIDLALAEAWQHREWATMDRDLRARAGDLGVEGAALLRECGGLLSRKLEWCGARVAALSPSDRRALKLPPV